jgi:polyadenylate-binding protein
MNGKMIGTKPLYVALAQRKDVRRQALESQMAQRANQRMQYAGGMGSQGYMAPPVYGYPPMPGYSQPGMMPMRGPMMGYQNGPQMMQARPRYPPNGQPGMPVPYGMPPMGAYPPNYPVRPGGAVNARPPTAPAANGPRVNGGPSPVGIPQGLPAGATPRGQMPVRPQNFGEQASSTQQPRLNAQTLARASPQDQKQMLGEALYPLIHESVPVVHVRFDTDMSRTQPDLAGKITGMLLEMDNGELLHLIESPPALQDKVDEALRVLAEWGKGNTDSAEAPAAPSLEAAKEENAE